MPRIKAALDGRLRDLHFVAIAAQRLRCFHRCVRSGNRGRFVQRFSDEGLLGEYAYAIVPVEILIP